MFQQPRYHVARTDNKFEVHKSDSSTSVNSTTGQATSSPTQKLISAEGKDGSTQGEKPMPKKNESPAVPPKPASLSPSKATKTSKSSKSSAPSETPNLSKTKVSSTPKRPKDSPPHGQDDLVVKKPRDRDRARDNGTVAKPSTPSHNMDGEKKKLFQSLKPDSHKSIADSHSQKSNMAPESRKATLTSPASRNGRSTANAANKSSSSYSVLGQFTTPPKSQRSSPYQRSVRANSGTSNVSTASYQKMMNKLAAGLPDDVQERTVFHVMEPHTRTTLPIYMDECPTMEAFFTAVADAAGVHHSRFDRVKVHFPGENLPMPTSVWNDKVRSWYHVWSKVRDSELWKTPASEKKMELAVELILK